MCSQSIEWMYYQSDSRQLLDIHRRFGNHPLKLSHISTMAQIWLPYFRGIKVVRPLDMVSYIKEDAKKFLTERFWQPILKAFESPSRNFMSYWLPKRFGYDVRRVRFLV